MTNKVAFITGASRGIGKATALALASKGFDIVISARTVNAGEQHQDMLKTADGQALSGSLEETLAEIGKFGVQAKAVRVDLQDTHSIDQALAQTLSAFGRIDALVNNATFHGEATNCAFEDVDVVSMQKIFQTNVYGPLYLTQCVVKQMLKQQGGTIINLTTGGAEVDPPMPTWQGGWGFNYGASKAAFHRLAGILNIELGGRGIKAFNLQPGVVTTESLMATLGDNGALAAQYGSAPPEVPAAVIHWLLTSKEADSQLGKTVQAQGLAKKLTLVQGWPAAKI